MRPVNAVPFTALIPLEHEHPVVIYNGPSALVMALVERAYLSLLDPSWNRPGVYVLLYPFRADGTFDFYVGRASTGGLRDRLHTHRGRKEDWTRALIVARDTTYGFNSAQVGWLEGRLWSLAKAGIRTRLTNDHEPRDETLPPYERSALESVLPPIFQILRLLGYTLEPEDEAPTFGRSYHGVSVGDLIQAGLIRPGQTLEFAYGGYAGRVALIQSNGHLLVEGQTHETLSAAAKAVRGGATNGWEHWATRDANGNLVSMAELRAKLQAAPGTPTRAAASSVDDGGQDAVP